MAGAPAAAAARPPPGGAAAAAAAANAIGVPPEELDEVMKLLEAYERSGRGLGEMPQELQELVANVRRAKGQQPAGAPDAEEITPLPGFVIKTTAEEGDRPATPGEAPPPPPPRKVFINLVHHPRVPAPGGWDAAAPGGGGVPPHVAEALEALARDDPAASDEALRFPLSCGELVNDTDKHGAPCSVVDVAVSSDVMRAAQQGGWASSSSRPLKAFLIELALDWVRRKHGLRLSARFKLPKMAYKGPPDGRVRPQRVRAERRALVTDVTGSGDDDAPSFPLVPGPRRPKQTPQRPAAAAGVGQRGSSGSGGGSGGGTGAAAAAGSSGGHDGGTATATAVAAATTAAAAVTGVPPGGSVAVSCEGRPVERMVVKVLLPPAGAAGGGGGSSSGSSGGPWTPSDVDVRLRGRQLRVELRVELRAPAAAAAAAAAAATAGNTAPIIEVQLPFAGDAGGATAQLVSPPSPPLAAAAAAAAAAATATATQQQQHQQQQELVVAVPRLPAELWVQELRAAAPRAFAALPVERRSAYLELD